MDSLKDFYFSYHDPIIQEAYNSPYWLRRYAHRRIHAQFLPYLRRGQRVLDAGCGEGVLSCLMAREGMEVIGTDISQPNIQGAVRLAGEWGVQAKFVVADAENLPFPDESFDVVVSSHVLEHLPCLDKGLHELYRLTRGLALIAMPTCLNPACWMLLGGDNFWRFRLRWRTPVALPLGLLKVLQAAILRREGPDEHYAGHQGVSHIWRFPWFMRRRIERAGFIIERFEAGPLIFLPFLAQWLTFLRRWQKALDQLCAWPVLRNFGYGSLAVCRKK